MSEEVVLLAETIKMPESFLKGELVEVNITLKKKVSHESASLWATVTGKTGSTVSGATVKIVGTGLSGKTDTGGNCRIGGVPPGSYPVEVSHPNYKTRVY